MDTITRRDFLSTSAMAGGGLAGMSLGSRLLANETVPPAVKPTVAISRGQDYFQSTVHAIEQLGGIGKFVGKGDRVGLLANSSYKKPGTYTRPEVMLAVAYLCKEAGAAGIFSFKGEKEKYWRRRPVSSKYPSLIKEIKEDDGRRKEAANYKAKIVKDPNVFAGFLDYDKVINLPILKNHGEIRLTCTLKNTMGIASMGTNMKFHLGNNYLVGVAKMVRGFYHNMDHLAQCIADLNLVRKWDLSIVDATEFIVDNGPSGPGKIARKDRIVAGVDPVAVEAVCGRYLKLKPQDSAMLRKAHSMGIGEMNLENISIQETEV